MTKILLVEDDDNLRGIYGDRLMAEGYEIVAARDGEEALAMAVNEKPDLIISDVMMPKISGFDMLDILRSTKETKDTKVIMMTALSQKEDQERGEKLGANRYLVKSQVTLEDVVRVAAEVLAEDSTPPNASPNRTVAEVAVTAQADKGSAEHAPNQPPQPSAETQPQAQQQPQPVVQTPQQTQPENQQAAPANDQTQMQPTVPPADAATSQEAQPSAPQPAPSAVTPTVANTPQPAPQTPQVQPVPEQQATAPAPPAQPQAPANQNTPKDGASTIESTTVGKQRSVQPINQPEDKPNINELYEKEIQKENQQNDEAEQQQTPPPKSPPSASGEINPNDISL